MEDLPAYTPQSIADILPIYRPQDFDGIIRTYSLRQTSPSIHMLHPCRDDATRSSSFEIKSNQTGGFMNRKPHVIITANDKKRRIAEGRFDIHGTGMTISYENMDTQRLELENSLAQVLRTQIQDCALWWQPYPGNKGVLELSNDMDEIIARFKFAAAPGSERTSAWLGRPGSMSEPRKRNSGIEIGELEVVCTPTVEDMGYERVICSAVMVIERAKRRAANMVKCATTKGVACWGMNAAPAGGFS